MHGPTDDGNTKAPGGRPTIHYTGACPRERDTVRVTPGTRPALTLVVMPPVSAVTNSTACSWCGPSWRPSGDQAPSARRQTLSESVWRRSVRVRNCGVSGFAPCETAKCPVSHLRNMRNAKCPVSHFEICEMRSVRFRTCECTIRIVPAPEHFAHTFSHAPFASSHMRAHLNILARNLSGVDVTAGRFEGSNCTFRAIHFVARRHFSRCRCTLAAAPC